MEIKDSPLSEAPAFLILIFLFTTVFINSRAESVFLVHSIALLLFFSYILMGTYEYKKGYISLILILLVFSLLFSNTALSILKKQINVADGQFYSGKGVVLSCRDWGWRSAVTIRTEDGRFVAYYRQNQYKPVEGTIAEIEGRYRLFQEKKNSKSSFSEKGYWLSRNVKAQLELAAFNELPEKHPLLTFRNYLRTSITANTPPRMASYLLALTLGERDKNLSAVHKRTGTVHLLAVSGFHVALLVAILSCILKRLKYRFILISIFLWLYVFVSGSSPGAVRAAIMMQVWLLGKILGEPVTSFNSISFALVLMLTFEPWIISDVGFQLSASSALVISGFSSRLRKCSFSGIVLTVLVWLMSTSLVLYHFKESNLAGLFNNIFAIPVFSVVLPLILLIFLLTLTGIPVLPVLLCRYMEEFLLLWERFSYICSDYLPYTLEMTLPLTALSLFVFFCSCSVGSGIKLRRTLSVSVLFTILSLCFI